MFVVNPYNEMESEVNKVEPRLGNVIFQLFALA